MSELSFNVIGLYGVVLNAVCVNQGSLSERGRDTFKKGDSVRFDFGAGYWARGWYSRKLIGWANVVNAGMKVRMMHYDGI